MNGSNVVLEVVLVLGLHRAAGLGTLELDVAVCDSQVDVQVLSPSDGCTANMARYLRMEPLVSCE